MRRMRIGSRKMRAHQWAAVIWAALTLGLLAMAFVYGKPTVGGVLMLLLVFGGMEAGLALDFHLHRRKSDDPSAYGLGDFVHDLLTED